MMLPENEDLFYIRWHPRILSFLGFKKKKIVKVLSNPSKGQYSRTGDTFIFSNADSKKRIAISYYYDGRMQND